MKLKKAFLILSCLLLLLSSFFSVSWADVIEYDAGTYVSPAYNTIIGTQTAFELDHNYFYTWTFDDLNNVPVDHITSINVVFHNIYNWQIEPNWLTVYLYDEPLTNGWNSGYDAQNITYPLWEHPAVYGATSIGTWSYVDATKDVVFTTSDASLLAYLYGGDTFGIGIDPDCHFYGSEITVEVPVPEPATMLLLGAGLISMAGIGRKKFSK